MTAAELADRLQAIEAGLAELEAALDAGGREPEGLNEPPEAITRTGRESRSNLSGGRRRHMRDPVSGVELYGGGDPENGGDPESVEDVVNSIPRDNSPGSRQKLTTYDSVDDDACWPR